MTGLHLAQYRIDAELGRGGMGIVYRAHDTKLDRTVALKVLPPHALASEDDRARFQREARAAAKLNHAHIASIYEIGEAVPENSPHGTEARPFIAMEFVDGDSLADRIAKGPMKLEEAVRIASEAAQALGAAHKAGIVHRDVKSGNIMLTSDGEVKVLDFGLAKTAASTQLTRQGSTLGTVAYMSPEQARAEEVDQRTDLWALGVVLYEMIAGRLPFAADYEQAALYGILNEDPAPLTAVRTGVPMGLEWIVSKLLAKRTSDRYQNTADLLVDLRTVDLTSATMSRISAAGATHLSATGPAVPKGGFRERGAAVQVGAFLAVAALAALLGWWLGPRGEVEAPPLTTKRLVQSLPLGGVASAVDISPRGDLVAIATDRIHVFDLSRGTMRDYDLSGVFVYIAFSADGKQILVTMGSEIRILTLDSGSVVQVLESSEGGPRAEWVDAETIVYEERTTIYERSLTTGETRQVIEKDSLNGEYDIDFPIMLPGGRTLMATAQTRDRPDRIGFWDLDSGRNLGYLDLPATRVQYIDPGYLVFAEGDDAMAIPFDRERLEQTGPAIPIDRGVRVDGLSVSDEGTLVHVGAQIGLVDFARPVRPMVVQMEAATFTNLYSRERFPAALYRSAAVRPDGRSAAVVIEGDLAEGVIPPTDIWILDFESGTRRAMTTGGVSDYPAWSPTGDSLYFTRRGNNGSLMVKAASGRGGESVVARTSVPDLVDLSVSPDGRWAALSTGTYATLDAGTRVRIFDLNDVDSFRDLDVTPGGNPRHLDFSPDSRYLAYEDQGGIYVQSIEDLDSPPFMVWENGMTLPRWSSDGAMLFAMNADSGGEGVPIRLDPGFTTLGPPENYDELWWAFSSSFFDVFPEDQKFLFGIAETETDGVRDRQDVRESIDLHVIVNLPSELARGR